MSDNFNNPSPFGDQNPNPYASPLQTPTNPPQSPRQAVSGKVKAPAICLILVASLGLCASVFNLGYALFAEPPRIDPNAPQFAQDFQRGASGPLALVLQTAFVVVNLIIIVGAVQMMGFKSLGMALHFLKKPLDN